MNIPTDHRKHMRLALAALLVGMASMAASPLPAAEPQTLTIKDWTGRGFPPDLVNYAIEAGTAPRVFDADGKPVPVQVTPGERGKATLSFVAAVAANATATYTLRQDGPAAPAAVSATRDGDALVLANQLLAVKVPAPREKAFDQPVAADTLPAPILAFRGPDDLWKGEGRLLLKRPVKKFTVTQTAGGPVFTEIRYRLEYDGGGYYQAEVRVTDRAPFAQVREDYDLGRSAEGHGAATRTPAADFWQLDLAKGWQPDAAEYLGAAAGNVGAVAYPSLAMEEKAVTSANVNMELGQGSGAPTRCIYPGSCFGARYVSYYGVHVAAARQANPDSYPLALVVPLHKGSWRRSNGVPVYVRGGAVKVQFPMAVTPSSWLNEPTSDTSPFSMHEHDPDLPATTGRRLWALALAHPAMLTGWSGNPDATRCVGYSIRNLYGSVGLDRYKDYVLTWPDTQVSYPRVFLTPEAREKYREAMRADPQSPLLPLVKDYYWFTGNPETAGKEAADVQARLQATINMLCTALTSSHHLAQGWFGEPLGHADSVLSWPGLPAGDRERIRLRLALLCYLLTDADIAAAGEGSHFGNPNMGVAALMDRINVAALIPDHPRATPWRDYMAAQMAYKMGSMMAPEGAWCEYGASYHAHGYGKIIRAMNGVSSTKPDVADRLWAYHRPDCDYLLNLLSPFDSRYASRTLPGMANSPVGHTPHHLQAAGTFVNRDPELAAHLRWAWEQNAGQVITTGEALTLPAAVHPEVAAREPALASRIYPGFGVIFRAHQGPDETCLYLRSGYLWSHWNQDQGNLLLYAKGAVLLPPQPYQYGGPKDQGFPDKTVMRFGSPENNMPHGWADSNILDARFGKSVDYAWHSTGYPDWWIKPGAAPGWAPSGPNVASEFSRTVLPDLGQKEGGFAWDRQVVFLKSPRSKGANYFVIRDSTRGDGQFASWFNLDLLGSSANLKLEGERIAVDTEWPTKLDVLFPGLGARRFDIAEDKLGLDAAKCKAFTSPKGTVPSRDWLTDDGKPEAIGANFPRWRSNERHVLLRMRSAPGEDVAWVLHPRGEGESAPTARLLAPGVTRVETPEGTDTVFLSATPLEYQGEGIAFAGQAGVVRVPKTGEPELVLLRGSQLSFRGKTVNGPAAAEPQVTAEGDTIRFVAPAPAYVNLTHGNVGVRGMGPFDLTFTPEGITGTVDGDVRTLVVTWPEKILRPGYWMDGVLWYAGFSDEHSITRGTAAPQFAIAFGVSAGTHAVKIAEWEWPAMPPVPARAEVSLK